jgi:hypothetical protein
MNWSSMSDKDKRALRLGAIVLLVAGLSMTVRPYLAALSDARDRLATERATLAREQAAVSTARQNPQLQHVADSAMRTMRPRLFEGKDDVMASAELASYVGDAARRARVWLQDANTRPATPVAEGVRTLRVEIRAESDLHGTLTFLQALERGDKLVRVDRLEISRAPRSDTKDSETLSIAATISGFAVNDSVAVKPASSRPTVATLASPRSVAP